MEKKEDTIKKLNTLKKELLKYDDKKRLLIKYGFDFSDEIINNIEIMDIKEGMDVFELVFKNNLDDTIWQSHLLTSIKVNSFDNFQSAIEYSITKNNIKEQYWHKRTSFKFDDAVNIRKNKDNLFHSRIYSNVSCKYGNFVIEVAKGKSETFGNESYIALYHGKSEDIMDWNNFNFSFEGALKYRYADNDNNPMIIYQALPNMWTIDLRRWMYMFSNSNVYACDIKDKLAGVIVEDDKISEEYIPDFCSDVRKHLFNHREKPQAIFVHNDDKYKNILFFVKDNNDKKIDIVYECKMTYDSSDLIIESISTKKDGKITVEEICDVSNYLKQYKSNEFLHNVISELDIYCNIINNINSKQSVNKFDFSNPFILPITDFSKAVEVFRNSNLVELTENLIERYSKEIGIEINDIVNIYNQDNIEYHKKLIKESSIKNV